MSAAEKLPFEYLVQKLDELPTLPTVVHELNKLINDPMSSTGEIETVMEKDQSLTSRVLRLINSAYYAIPGGCTSLGRAIAFLGFDTVNQLVLAASIFKTLQVKGENSFDITGFWKHSIGTGMAAETIAKHVSHRMPSDLFTCGLVHDMGKVAVLIIDPEMLNSITESAAKTQVTFDEAEITLGVPTHTQIGQTLAQKWNLPLIIQHSIAYHHQKDPLRRGGISQEMSQAVDIVMLANLLVHALKYGNSGYAKIPAAPKPLFERLGIADKDFPELVKKIKTVLGNADSFLKVIGEG